jgi:hypothetical protein
MRWTAGLIAVLGAVLGLLFVLAHHRQMAGLSLIVSGMAFAVLAVRLHTDNQKASRS